MEKINKIYQLNLENISSIVCGNTLGLALAKGKDYKAVLPIIESISPNKIVAFVRTKKDSAELKKECCKLGIEFELTDYNQADGVIHDSFAVLLAGVDSTNLLLEHIANNCSTFYSFI